MYHHDSVKEPSFTFTPSYIKNPDRVKKNTVTTIVNGISCDDSQRRKGRELKRRITKDRKEISEKMREESMMSHLERA